MGDCAKEHYFVAIRKTNIAADSQSEDKHLLLENLSFVAKIEFFSIKKFLQLLKAAFYILIIKLAIFVAWCSDSVPQVSTSGCLCHRSKEYDSPSSTN